MLQLDTRLPLGVQPFDLGAVQRNTLAAMQQRAAEQEMDNRNALATAMQTYGQGVLSPDAGKRTASIAGLAAAGPAGFQTALPLMQQEQQRLRPMTADEARAAGLRPGTVAMVNGLGVPQILQQPDTMSDDAFNQRLRLTVAGREPPVTWTDVRDPSGTLIGQRSSRGQFNPVSDPGMTPARANAILARFAPGYGDGSLSADEERLFEQAYALTQRPQSYFDEQQGRLVTIPPVVAPYVARALEAREARLGGRSVPQSNADNRPAAPQPQAAPGQTGQVGAPAPTPAPAATAGGATVQQVAPPRTNNEPMSADAAARVALVREGVRAVQDLEGRIISDRGIDRNLLAGMWAGVPVGESAQYLNLVANAIGNRLRIETGAVIGRDEEINMARRYLPRPWDSPELVRQKLAGLRTYFTDFEQLTSPGGRNMPPASQPAPSAQPSAAAPSAPPAAAVPRIVINPRGEIVR